MRYRYKFVCEHLGMSIESQEEIVEYDYEPDEDELESDYEEWVFGHCIAGGYEKLEGKEND